ncbi:MAG: thioredoxin [Anaerolineae bacterium]|nr:thioredoxin [Anaerolineae bacterium]
MAAKLSEVTANTFQNDVLNSSQPVLVDFWAEWCSPCKMIAPIVEQIAHEQAGKLKVVAMDTDANPDVPIQFGIMSIPTLILFKGGQPVVRITGYQAKDRILSQIQPHLN